VFYNTKWSTKQALVTEIQQFLWMKKQDVQAWIYWFVFYFYLIWVFRENLGWKPSV